MARIFSQVDVLLVPSLRDEMLTIGNFTGHPSLTFRAGFVEVGEARSDWAPDPANPLPKFSPPRRVPHGVTLDRKSTRLNSSHLVISYAVFCLKKKQNTTRLRLARDTNLMPTAGNNIFRQC